jgi:TetR/AcrR family transcriptional regulator, cholesterol catabolism regulator
VGSKAKSGESREQLLQLAEALFGERGYAAVTLRDIQ